MWRRLGCCKRYVVRFVPVSFSGIHPFNIYLEPFNDNGTLASDVFLDTIGPSYIELALIAARAADPHAKLYVSTHLPGSYMTIFLPANLR